VGDSSSFVDISDERWAKSFEINLMGCIRTCRALLPAMAETGSASVVNTGSDLAKQPEFTLMDYGVCKAGLLYLTKALAKQYAPRVRVNAVLPGPVWTRMWTRPGGIVDQLIVHYGAPDRDAAVQKFLEDRYLPLGIGQPEDVANAVVFLASPLAKFITGCCDGLGRNRMEARPRRFCSSGKPIPIRCRRRRCTIAGCHGLASRNPPCELKTKS
jgi:NAD(P)-dependent dehydrogenase (short-subunit alcohol dehydrogenase family)